MKDMVQLERRDGDSGNLYAVVNGEPLTAIALGVRVLRFSTHDSKKEIKEGISYAWTNSANAFSIGDGRSIEFDKDNRAFLIVDYAVEFYKISETLHNYLSQQPHRDERELHPSLFDRLH